MAALLAAALARGQRSPEVEEVPAASWNLGPQRWILPLVLAAGVVSFTYEVLWSRLLTHALGGSSYAFATMLASFLIGIALGSALASRLAATRQRAVVGFAVAQICVAVLSLVSLAAIDALAGQLRALDLSRHGILATGSTAGALCLLPGALCIGATFPFAVRFLVRRPDDAPAASALVYAWSTLGAIIGALTAGFVTIPALGFAGAAAAGAVLSVTIALCTALLHRPALRHLAVAAVAAAMVLVLLQPATPWAVLRSSVLEEKTPAGRLVHFGVGRSATVLLTEIDGEWRLTSDGLPESTIQRPGARPSRFAVSRWLGLLPLLGKPDTSSLLLVGLGAGNSIEDLPGSIREIHVAEIEEEIVSANRAIGAVRRKDPLADPRVHLHVADARSLLLLTERSFDAIVSQPSHPWTAGSAQL
jgi:spermidine synthase